MDDVRNMRCANDATWRLSAATHRDICMRTAVEQGAIHVTTIS